MASIHAHGSHWRVHYQAADGSKHKSPTLASREAADAWIAANIHKATLNTWGALLDAWVAEHPARYRVCFATTWVKKATGQGWKKPQDVTAAGIDEWLRTTKVARAKSIQDGTRKTPSYGAALRYLLALLRWGAKPPRLVPVRPEVLTYSQSLTSLTGGRGDYHMEFLRYEEVPSHIAQKLIEAAKKDQEAVPA